MVGNSDRRARLCSPPATLDLFYSRRYALVALVPKELLERTFGCNTEPYAPPIRAARPRTQPSAAEVRKEAMRTLIASAAPGDVLSFVYAAPNCTAPNTRREAAVVWRAPVWLQAAFYNPQTGVIERRHYKYEHISAVYNLGGINLRDATNAARDAVASGSPPTSLAPQVVLDLVDAAHAEDVEVLAAPPAAVPAAPLAAPTAASPTAPPTASLVAPPAAPQAAPPAALLAAPATASAGPAASSAPAQSPHRPRGALILRYARSADPSDRTTQHAAPSPFQPRICAPTAMAQPSGVLSPLPAAGAGLARAGAGRPIPATPSPARQLAWARAEERPVEDQRLAQIERQGIRKVLAPSPSPPPSHTHTTTSQSHALTSMCHPRCQKASETGRPFHPRAAF